MFARGQIVDSSCRFACPRPSHANNSSNARVPLTYACLLSAHLQQHNLNRLQEHLIGVTKSLGAEGSAGDGDGKEIRRGYQNTVKIVEVSRTTFQDALEWVHHYVLWCMRQHL